MDTDGWMGSLVALRRYCAGRATANSQKPFPDSRAFARQFTFFVGRLTLLLPGIVGRNLQQALDVPQ